MSRAIPPEYGNLCVALVIIAVIWTFGSRLVSLDSLSRSSFLGRTFHRWEGFGERSQRMIKTGVALVSIGCLTLFLRSVSTNGVVLEELIAFIAITVGTGQIVKAYWQYRH